MILHTFFHINGYLSQYIVQWQKKSLNTEERFCPFICQLVILISFSSFPQNYIEDIRNLNCHSFSHFCNVFHIFVNLLWILIGGFIILLASPPSSLRIFIILALEPTLLPTVKLEAPKRT